MAYSPRILAVAVSVVVGTSSSGQASAQTRRDPVARLADYVERSREVWGVPGVAVVVVKDDSVVFLRGFGVRTVGKAEPVDPETVFAIASISKTFTGTALAMLVAERKISWDDRVTRWLPWFQLEDPYVTREARIRDLMSHRTGVGQQADMLWYMSGYDRDTVIARMRFLHPNASFRSAVGYQNVMVTAAGQVVGAASGQSWDEFVRRRIFEPLGMTASSTSVKDLAGRANLAAPHNLVDGQARVVPWHSADNIGPAGSINSTARDLGAYLRFQLAGGRYRGQELVTAAALAETKTPQIYIDGMGADLRGFAAEGLGWVIEQYRGKKIVRHDGGIDGMLAELWTVPEERLGFAVLTNGEPHMLAPSISRWILERYLGGPERDWNPEYLKAARENDEARRAAERRLETGRVRGTSPSIAIAGFRGTYRNRMYGEMIIADGSDGLVARYRDFTGPLAHWHYNTFRATWQPGYLAGRMFFTFQLGADGEVARVDVQGLGVFDRSP